MSLETHKKRSSALRHDAKWYKLSLKAQRTLYIMLLRCNVACKLTAGKISIMSIENFTVVRPIDLLWIFYFTYKLHCSSAACPTTKFVDNFCIPDFKGIHIVLNSFTEGVGLFAKITRHVQDVMYTILVSWWCQMRYHEIRETISSLRHNNRHDCY